MVQGALSIKNIVKVIILLSFLVVPIDQYLKNSATEANLVVQDPQDQTVYQGRHQSIFGGDYHSISWKGEYTYVRNFGASWGFLNQRHGDVLSQARGAFLIAMGILLPIALLGLIKILVNQGLALNSQTTWSVMAVIAGSLGNLLDRLRLGYVIDFILLQACQNHRCLTLPAFNFADVVVVASLFGLIVSMWRPLKVTGDSAESIPKIILFCGLALVASSTQAQNVPNYSDDLRQRLDHDQSSNSILQNQLLNLDLSTAPPNVETGVTHLLRGIILFKNKYPHSDGPFPEVAAEMVAAKKQLGNLHALTPLVSTYLGRARLNKKNAKAQLNQLKKMIQSRQTPTTPTTLWRPEQISLLIEILMQLNQDAPLTKAWFEMQARVRPSERDLDLEQKLTKYMEKHKITVTSPLFSVLEDIASNYPHSKTSEWAFRKLMDLACDKKHPYFFSTSLLLKLAGNVNLDDGLKDFIIQTTLGKVQRPSGAIRSFDLVERVEFLIQLKFFAEARKVLEGDINSSSGAGTTANNLPGRFKSARLLSLLGQVQTKQNDFDAAAKTWSLYVEKYSDILDMRFALENLADALMRLRAHIVAAHIYEKLSKDPKSDPNLKWNFFWNLYLGKDYQGALAVLDTIGYVPMRDSNIPGFFDYWRGKILEKLGDTKHAGELYQKILKSTDDSYYAMIVQATHPQLLMDDDEDDNGVNNGRNNGDKKIIGPSKKRLSATDISTLATLKKWNFLKIGRKYLHYLFADYYMSSHLRGKPNDAEQDQVMLAWAQSFEDYNLTLKFTSEDSDQGDEKNQFPVAFGERIFQLCDPVGIDPYLVLSIMRSESVYDPGARSSVGAQGLMQLMPFTAIRVARDLSDSQFDLNDLQQVDLNIGFGAFYLTRLLNYYRGHVLLAIGAYNSGPKSMDRWLATYHDLEIDEFIESIPFKETRRYVKNVFKNYHQYHQVWRKDGVLDVFVKPPLNPIGGDIY